MPPSRPPDELGPFYRRARYEPSIGPDDTTPQPEEAETADSPTSHPDDSDSPTSPPDDSDSPTSPPDDSDSPTSFPVDCDSSSPRPPRPPRSGSRPPPGPDRAAQTPYQDEAWRPAAASDRSAPANAPTPPDEASRRAAASNGGAIAGFVLGVFSFTPLLGTIVGVPGILLSRRGLSRSRLDGAPYGRLAMAGFLLSIIATSLNGLLWVLFLIGILVGAEGS